MDVIDLAPLNGVEVSVQELVDAMEAFVADPAPDLWTATIALYPDDPLRGLAVYHRVDALIAVFASAESMLSADSRRALARMQDAAVEVAARQPLVLVDADVRFESAAFRAAVRGMMEGG